MGKYLEDRKLDSILEAYFNEINNSDTNYINFFGKELNIRHVYLSG